MPNQLILSRDVIKGNFSEDNVQEFYLLMFSILMMFDIHVDAFQNYFIRQIIEQKTFQHSGTS